MFLIDKLRDALKTYKADLENKIFDISYKLENMLFDSNTMFDDYINQAAKYTKRLEIVDGILKLLDKGNKLVK